MKINDASVHPFHMLADEDLRAWSHILATQAETRAAFLTPTFCRAVADHFPGVRVLVFRETGQAIGFLPLQAGSGLFRLGGVHEPVGGGMSDYFGMVARSGSHAAIAELLDRVHINAVSFTHLDEKQLAFGLPGEQPRIGLRTRMGHSGELFWESLRRTDKKLVSDTERRERKLATEVADIHFELSSSNPEADLDEMVALKQSQYLRTGKHSAPLFDSRNIALLHTLLHARDPACSGLLSVLRVDGTLVAAHFGLQCHEILHFWFPVYAHAFHAYSPGRILLKNIIMGAASRGIETIDRGEGDTPAKRDFATDEHRYYRGIWSRPGLPGQLGRAASALQWRWQRWLDRHAG